MHKTAAILAYYPRQRFRIFAGSQSLLYGFTSNFARSEQVRVSTFIVRLPP